MLWVTHLSPRALARALEWFVGVADDASAVRHFARAGGAGEWRGAALQTVSAFAAEVGAVLAEVEADFGAIDHLAHSGAPNVSFEALRAPRGGGGSSIGGAAAPPMLPTLLDARRALERPAAVLRALRAAVARALPSRARTSAGPAACDLRATHLHSPAVEVGEMLTTLQTALEEAAVVDSATLAVETGT